MNKRFYPIAALLILAFAALACGLPTGNGGNQPAPSGDQVATIVAMTMQALTPASDGGTTPVVATEPPVASLLPHTFYYLGNDKTGLVQVFRVERDGATIRQVTFEPVNVTSYDVSPLDGSVVYVSNNQLLSVNADGSSRSLLVDGGAVDPNNQMATSLSNPVFSPDAQTIAYGLRGLNLYSIIGGVSSVILPQYVDAASGQLREMYIPKNYSPDGTKLLITTAIPNSDGISTGIFTIATSSLVRLSGEGALFCCSKQAWTVDSSALYSANRTIGMFGSGLWRVDAATGTITTLVQSDAGDGTFNLFDEPYLAPDGQLYYFFDKAPAPEGMIDRSPLQLVRSGLDGVTGRTVILADNFQLLNEALWAPDASFVIVAFAPIQDVYVGGQAEIVYLDGRPSVVLATFAYDMKWGP